MLLSLGRTGRPTGNTVSGNLESFFDERREKTAGGVSSETDYMNHEGTKTKLLRFRLVSLHRELHLEHGEHLRRTAFHPHQNEIPSL